MTIQDNSDDGESCTFFPGGNGSLLDDGGQITTDEGYVPKIRKPYTITKQRERWTEEEHKKFLEAVNLYGRAWRKIEEHVGTKTAVQIRSHAQKFFSKVVRESKSSQSSSFKPLEIPPPRPKKKPTHPYPRKLALPAKTDVFLQENPVSSTSPNSSVDQEQHSPTSVLSTVASDTVGYADSGMPDGSLSPSESTPMVLEDASQSDVPVSAQMELFSRVGCLKLFGKTLLLDNLAQASSSSPFLEQESATKILNFTVVKPDESLNQFSSSILPAPVPLRAFSGGVPFPFDNIVSVKEEAQEDGSVIAPVNANLIRASSEKYATAFVPYKRSLSENEMQSTRLCL